MLIDTTTRSAYIEIRSDSDKDIIIIAGNGRRINIRGAWPPCPERGSAQLRSRRRISKIRIVINFSCSRNSKRLLRHIHNVWIGAACGRCPYCGLSPTSARGTALPSHSADGRVCVGAGAVCGEALDNGSSEITRRRAINHIHVSFRRAPHASRIRDGRLITEPVSKILATKKGTENVGRLLDLSHIGIRDVYVALRRWNR